MAVTPHSSCESYSTRVSKALLVVIVDQHPLQDAWLGPSSGKMASLQRYDRRPPRLTPVEEVTSCLTFCKAGGHCRLLRTPSTWN